MFAPLGLASIYPEDGDAYSGFVNPTNVRKVNIDYLPTYFAEEEVYQAKLRQSLGDQFTLNVTGGYSRNVVRSRTDYNLAVNRSYANNPGLLALEAFANDPTLGYFFGPVADTLIPNGAAGGVCQSDADPNNVGVYGGNSVGCHPTSLDFDESSQTYKQWAVEAHLDSDFDGMFNFLIGANYVNAQIKNNSYYVNSFGLDYASGVLGAIAAAGAALAGAEDVVPQFRPSPFYRNNSDKFRLKSYGIFGEAYFEFNDRVKLTLGLRYNNDKKSLRARTTLLSDGTATEFSGGAPIYAPYGATGFEDAFNWDDADFDAGTPGVQKWQERNVGFDKLTGRAVLDFKITPDNLLYASYSRGYKSGGINPPVSVGNVPSSFEPEQVDAFEIGSKNRFGALQLNLTGFYYKYKNLQLSRIVARTSVNDNINANIYGVEAEALMSPAPNLLINMNASYLKTKVAGDRHLVNPRDVSGGRSDTVIIKDISLANNCAVRSNVGSGAAAKSYVDTINGFMGLREAIPIPGTNTTGAFSLCAQLAGNAATVGSAFGGITVSSGETVNVRGNQLPQAPEFKWSAGIQYTAEFGNGMSLVPRVDYAYTGESYGTVFNGLIDRIKGYDVINAQIQLNGVDDKWFLRGFVQNLTNNNATTGLYVTDQSSGLFTNIFTLEPRRYGIAAGVRF